MKCIIIIIIIIVVVVNNNKYMYLYLNVYSLRNDQPMLSISKWSYL